MHSIAIQCVLQFEPELHTQNLPLCGTLCLVRLKYYRNPSYFISSDYYYYYFYMFRRDTMSAAADAANGAHSHDG